MDLESAVFLAQIEIQLGFLPKVGDLVEFFPPGEIRNKIIETFYIPERISEYTVEQFCYYLSPYKSGKIYLLSFDKMFFGPEIVILNDKKNYIPFPLACVKSINGVNIDYEELANRR